MTQDRVQRRLAAIFAADGGGRGSGGVGEKGRPATGYKVAWMLLPSVLSCHLDHMDEAHEGLEEFQGFRLGLTKAFMRDPATTVNRHHMDHLIDGLRKAGLPE